MDDITTLNVAPQKNRLAYIDNLKAMTIILVIIEHAGVTYSGIGGWYYNEPHTLSHFAAYFFMFVLTFNQAFFMSLFFFIAAYFVPPSLEKKGATRFIGDRLFRLGIPTIIFMLLISPIVFKMANPEINLLQLYEKGITSFGFLNWTGPMWFALTLLIFSIIYTPVNSWFSKIVNKYSFAISCKNVIWLIMMITIAAFAIRLIYPIGTAVINLQFCFFAAYIFMFIMGIIARKKDILANLNYQLAKKYFFAAFIIGIPLWSFVIYFAMSKAGLANIAQTVGGGWHWLPFAYAVWESFFCVTIIIGLVGIFKEKFNTQNRLQKFLSTNAFGVYVFHPLILVGVSILLKDLHFYPVLKFIVVVSLVVPLSFIFASLVRRVGVMRKLFS